MNTASLLARALLCTAIAFLTVVPHAWAQPAPAPGAASTPGVPLPASSSTQRAVAAQPAPAKAWNELTAVEQKALRPLAANWNNIDAAQKRKWLAVSKNFNALSPAEQAKLHSRMSEWVALSPKERSQARLNFAETTKVPPDEKRAKWEAYQALPPEEKSKLAASATPRPAGGATAVKPVPPQKLATPANAKPPRSGASGAAGTTKQVDQNTLLPRKPASSP